MMTNPLNRYEEPALASQLWRIPKYHIADMGRLWDDDFCAGPGKKLLEFIKHKRTRK